MIALGVASVPDVKISSDTAAASRSGSDGEAPPASTSSSGMPTDGDRSHTTCTGFTPVRAAVSATSRSWSNSRYVPGAKIGAGPCGLEDVRKLVAPGSSEAAG